MTKGDRLRRQLLHHRTSLKWVFDQRRHRSAFARAVGYPSFYDDDEEYRQARAFYLNEIAAIRAKLNQEDAGE